MTPLPRSRAREVSGKGCLRHDRRGGVALLVGLVAPVLLMALGLGIEVSRWSVAKLELQRIADAAALAGAFDYQHQATKVLQTAAVAAANLAWYNGVTGVAAPTWTAATNLLTDNLITVQIIAGLRTASDTAVQVTVVRLVPLYLAGIFRPSATQTVTATAVAELVTATGGGLACVLALQGDSNGITTNEDIQLSNGVQINTNGCALRSDASVQLTGGATVDGNVIAAGQVSISNGASITSPFAATSNAGQIPDPLASDTMLQNALAAAATASGSAENCSGGQCTISPGNFTGIAVSNGATLTLRPGLYTVNGPVNFAGGTVTVQAGGVSIITSGQVSIGNGVAVNGFVAATPGSAGVTGGAIPGVLLATSATNSSGSNPDAATFNGGASFAFAGLMYVPNGTLSISNGVSTSTPGCAEVVASDVIMAGGATFASSTCAGTFGSTLPTVSSQLTSTAVLVQ